MAENMFELRKKETRRKQFIEENLDVADEIINTNPNLNILKNEKIIENEEIIEEETPVVEIKEESPTITPFKLSLYKKEKISKDNYSYYLESAIDELAVLIGEKMNISKSEFINLILKSALLTNEDIQELSKIDEKVQNLLEKLKK